MDHASKVHSLSFGRYTFKRPETITALQISSPMREDHVAKLCPKYVVNPSLVNALFTHWPTSWVDGAVGLGLPENVNVANHYRTDEASTTTLADITLVKEEPAIRQAI